MKIRGRRLVTKCFGLYSNSRGADEIKHLPISINFQIQKHRVVTFVYYYNSIFSDSAIYVINYNTSRFCRERLLARSFRILNLTVVIDSDVYHLDVFHLNCNSNTFAFLEVPVSNQEVTKGCAALSKSCISYIAK